MTAIGLSALRTRQATIVVTNAATNLIGAAVVAALVLVVIPLPHNGRLTPSAYVLVTVAYLLVAVPIAVASGVQARKTVRAWLDSGAPGPAPDAVIHSVLDLPARSFVLELGLWAVAAAGLGAFEALRELEQGLWVGVIVLLAGVTTASSSYVLTELLSRPIVARVLDGVAAARLSPRRGVAMRALLAWAMGTGIPLVGLLALGLRTLAPAPVTLHEMSVAVVCLAAAGLIVGLELVYLASKATSDPVTDVASALSRVRDGVYEVRTPVYDGTEVGHLQAGFNELVVGLQERERIRAAFGAYVDPDVAEFVLGEGARLGEEVELSMMFVDIRDFTAFAEQTSPTVVVETINRLFERAVPIIRDRGGHVDKFVGDGLLAVFGAPRSRPDHAEQAVMAGIEIAAAVSDEFDGDLSVGVGVNSGRVVAGSVGGAGRFEFSVIGDAVNVAARIEAATRRTGDRVLISAGTRGLIAGSVSARALDFIERPGIVLKGKERPVSLYGVGRRTG